LPEVYKHPKNDANIIHFYDSVFPVASRPPHLHPESSQRSFKHDLWNYSHTDSYVLHILLREVLIRASLAIFLLFLTMLVIMLLRSKVSQVAN